MKKNIDFIKKFADSLSAEHPDLVELIELKNIWSWSAIRTAYPKLKLMVSMGFSFKDLGLQCSNVPYQLIRLQNTYLIYTDVPERIQSDKNLKLQLWNEVKSLSI